MAQIRDLDIIEKNESLVPLSYIPIEMSTQGRLNVPKIVYCRNFNAEDILTLSMISTSILPERIISVLNSIIYGNIDVSLWPDKSIIELLIQIYANYFTPIFFQAKFPWDETDIEWLKLNSQDMRGELLKKRLWVPRVDIDIRTAIHITQLDPTVKESITIKKNKDNKVIFTAKFLSYPKYGDVLTLKQYIKDKYPEDHKYDSVRLLAEKYSQFADEDKDLSLLPPIDLDLYLEWQSIELQKDIDLAKATKALYLLSYNNIDMSQTSLEEKIKIISQPEFDIIVSKKLDDHYSKLKFGVDPQIKIKNPITGEDCVRDYVFRLDDVLSAIQSGESTGYDISYDD